MSIENVTARIAELQARIDALSWATAAPAPPAQSQPANVSTGPKPFDVALAQANGLVQLQPTAGKLSPQIDALVEKYSAQNGLNPRLVRAVIAAESDGDAMSLSNKGAMGLMQLMPDEIKAYGIKNPYDPEQNIAGGTRQLAEKMRLFNGDVRLALAAYNAGSGAVRRYGGVPPYPETQNYVNKILSALEDGR